MGLFLGGSGIQGGLRVSVRKSTEVELMCWDKERLQRPKGEQGPPAPCEAVTWFLTSVSISAERKSADLCRQTDGCS